MSPKGAGNARRGVATAERGEGAEGGKGEVIEGGGTGQGGFQTRPYDMTQRHCLFSWETTGVGSLARAGHSYGL